MKTNSFVLGGAWTCAVVVIYAVGYANLITSLVHKLRICPDFTCVTHLLTRLASLKYIVRNVVAIIIDTTITIITITITIVLIKTTSAVNSIFGTSGSLILFVNLSG